MAHIERGRSNVIWNDVLKLYHAVGWSKHNTENIIKIYNSSTHTSFAYVDGQLAGLGRALSDGVFNAAIYDVIVSPDYQGLGLGREIVVDLLAQLQDVSCVHLISTTGNEEFYRKAGLKMAKTAMARYLNKEMESEYLL
ncbi:GNAT family N-acetyltransferase [Fictibacillus sp. KU28468]|uniref:GNAT family N-acetyltransferase n=1 Tax=Fictibacillus sp. KU28468 TaxID=2991053 RepID=UPI000A4F8566